MRRAAKFAALALVLGSAAAPMPAAADATEHEVWIIDQSDTRPDGGGTLYIYQGDDVAGRGARVAAPAVVDLGGAARDLCLTQTGTAPRRPHMMLFNGSGTHAVIAFVATGHVLFMDAATAAPVACVDVGVQAHAATPSPDETYVVVANQNGKLLQRIATDYATDSFTLDAAATIDLATCVTPSGAPCQDPVLRPDNAPICPVVTLDSSRTFVTLRGGGLFVVDSTATPMAIVGEYDKAAVHPNGCGGAQAGDALYINSGGGTAGNPFEHDLYRFDVAAFGSVQAPNTPTAKLVYSRDAMAVGTDAHGATLTKHNRYLWVGDRAANAVVIVDVATDQVVGGFSLSGGISADPAPDLMVISPDGNRVYASLRGPNPLTGNAPGANNAVGSTPGLGIMRVERGGARGAMHAVTPISHVVDGVERADPHGIAVRPVATADSSARAVFASGVDRAALGQIAAWSAATVDVCAVAA